MEKKLKKLRLDTRLLIVKAGTTQSNLAERFMVHPATLNHAITGTREGPRHIELLHQIHNHLKSLTKNKPS